MQFSIIIIMYVVNMYYLTSVICMCDVNQCVWYCCCLLSLFSVVLLLNLLHLHIQHGSNNNIQIKQQTKQKVHTSNTQHNDIQINQYNSYKQNIHNKSIEHRVSCSMSISAVWLIFIVLVAEICWFVWKNWWNLKNRKSKINFKM